MTSSFQDYIQQQTTHHTRTHTHIPSTNSPYSKFYTKYIHKHIQTQTDTDTHQAAIQLLHLLMELELYGEQSEGGEGLMKKPKLILANKDDVLDYAGRMYAIHLIHHTHIRLCSHT
ncbi:hypothetical protein EON63_06490 [archaeon]|nr:MAG: hypothetical protein EON63_06490 [archaeon]